MTYPDSPQIVVGTRTLMIALAAELEQSTQSGRLPEVLVGQPFWARTDQAAELVAAAWRRMRPPAPRTRPGPPTDAGFARGTSNASPS